MRHRRPQRTTALFSGTLALTTAAAGLVLGSPPSASAAPAAPTSVYVAGTLDSELGCSGDWQTDCAQTLMTRRTSDGMWSLTKTLPAGTYAYKAAVNGSWTENYGAHATAGGADIPLTVPSGGKQVTFVYDPVTHWVTDDVNSKIVTAPGDFQSETGCGSDWAPECLRPWLEDIDGDGTYTYTTTSIPAGSWQTKAAIGMSWSESYGVGGAASGANIPFSVPGTGATTAFSYNAGSHLLTVNSSGGTTTPTDPAGPASPLNTLGAIYTPTATTFRIWSPDNTNVTLSTGGRTYTLARATVTGYTDIYQTVVSGDLKNQSYQFSVGGNAVRDPYAQMVGPGSTQGIVVDTAAIKPTGGSWNATPALANREDSLVYELSPRDYTIDPSSGIDAPKRGKFLGLVQTGTTSSGAKTGIDHLKDLGVTAVQIMPSFDFNSTVPNWGYDPANYNVPEEQYSQFTSPEDRIREFQDMVNGFHKNGIRVIMDVVYNHTYSTDTFRNITNKYYTAGDLSGTGNSLDDGNPMVARMIQDSLEHWVRDYNVDGFRFDLMGVHHTTNAAAWGSYLNSAYPGRNLVIYGEPWSAANDEPLAPQKVRYGAVPALATSHVGVFNGNYRDAIRGGTRDTILGYMGGSGTPSSIALGMSGSPLTTKSTAQLPDPWSAAFTYDPEQTMNYASIHDDLNLYDKITYSGLTGGAAGTAGKVDKFAVGMVLTSQGIPVISEGDEFLRSKAVNGDYNTAGNSYNAGDNVNAIHWGDQTTNAVVQKFYKDAIALRKSTPALRLTTWDAIHNQMTTKVSGSVVIGSISSSAAAPTTYDTVVVYNPTTNNFTATLPTGTWTKVLDSTGAVSTTGNTTCGGQSVTVFKKS